MVTAIATTESPVPSGDAEIVTQAFGVPSDPAVLLIMGQMASMLWWPESLCERLAENGRFVIRYDNRDTGRSTAYEPGKPDYTGDDFVDDAVAVLDGYGFDRAHVVGMSAGGAIAQLVALRYPARVASVTAISTTKIGETDRALPGPTAQYMAHAGAAGDLDWSDMRAAQEFIVSDARALAGTAHPFDEAAARDLVARDLERARRPESLVNHSLVSGGEDRGADAAEISAPFLVIHGTADPLFPHEHGVALAEAIPGARLVTIEGGGHELHEADWDQIVEAIATHTATR